MGTGHLVSVAKKAKLRPGEVVAGRYRIDGIVGRGGFGAVYRATHTDSGRSVALKVLVANYSSSKVDGRRFQREAALVQRIKHPSVVELLDYGQTDNGMLFIAFELLQGEALNQVLKEKGPLPLQRVAEIGRDVLRALEVAHAIGVIHRDIKPQNVFLCEGGASKVLDFGIAKAMNPEDASGTQLTEAGQMIGTPQYMAPEQVRGATVLPSTDLYSLGLVMSEMLSGERVVKGEALIDIYMTHIAPTPLDFPPSVQGSPLFPVIARAAQKDAAGRYPTARSMLVALHEALPSLGPLERPGLSAAAKELMAKTTEIEAEPESLNSTYRIDDNPPRSGAGTVLMVMPDLEQRVREEAQRRERARLAGGTAPQRPLNPLEATVDMVDAQQAEPRDWQRNLSPPGAWPASLPPSAQPPSGPSIPPGPHSSGPPSQTAPASASYASYGSGLHARPSWQPQHGSGEHPLGSGEHKLSGEHRIDGPQVPKPPPAARHKGGGAGMVVALLILAAVAAAAAVLLWLRPWQ
jgi:serine/threonine-protein kinase